MFLESSSGLRREHRKLVIRIRQVGDERMLGEMKGAEAQPIPAVGLRSRWRWVTGNIPKPNMPSFGRSGMADIWRRRGIVEDQTT